MADAIRFFFDQHIPPAVAHGLRQRGVDVLTAQEADRCGLSDADQLQCSTAQGRVLLTFDRDYLALGASAIDHAGIAWYPTSKYSIGQLIQALFLIHGVLSGDEMRNHIEYV